MRSLRIEFKRRPRQLAVLACVAVIGLIATTTLIVFITKPSKNTTTTTSSGRNESVTTGASASSDEPRNKNLRQTSSPSTAAPTTTTASQSPTHSTTSFPSTLPLSFFSSSVNPSAFPSPEPSTLPSAAPTRPPTMTTAFPSANPSLLPSLEVHTTTTTLSPTTTTTKHDITIRPTFLTYIPGDLSVHQQGLLLSTGLQAKLIATTGQPVRYANSSYSTRSFHGLPDFGATFPRHSNNKNAGGWIYVSNSEMEERGTGGVGALTFNQKGGVIAYQMVLEGTTRNCGGGPTPWVTWISCEETPGGQNWQVDPTGQRPAEIIELGKSGGQFESFAYDIVQGHYFVTEDDAFGPLRRWIPAQQHNNETDLSWSTLHGPGETTYLRLIPTTSSGGTYEWITDQQAAANNANVFYRNSEGIDVYGRELYFVSKELKTLFIMNLNGNNYTSHTTRQGLFDGQPDQLARVIGGRTDDVDSKQRNGDEHPLLYFTEDGGQFAGVHARNRHGQYLTILESHVYTNDETTGLAFSPDNRFMYVAYQKIGKLFAIFRQDGLPFDAVSLNVKYHAA